AQQDEWRVALGILDAALFSRTPIITNCSELVADDRAVSRPITFDDENTGDSCAVREREVQAFNMLRVLACILLPEKPTIMDSLSTFEQFLQITAGDLTVVVIFFGGKCCDVVEGHWIVKTFGLNP